MSLIRTAVRMCAIAALRDATWAEDRVFDSDNRPLVDVLKEKPEPYITVYTDEDTRNEIDGRDLFSATRSMSLILEIGVASAVKNKTTNAAGEEVIQTTITIPNTDEALEFTVDIIEMQSLNALFGNVLNPYSEILRRMVNKFYRIPSQRGGSAQHGTRWAARQTSFIMDTICDVPPGTVYPPKHPVRDFIEQAYSESPESNMKIAAQLMEKVINANELPGWQQAQAWLNYTREEIEAIGQAPIVLHSEGYTPALDDQPPVLDTANLEDDGVETDSNVELGPG